MTIYADIALPLPLPQVFTYQCPDSFAPLLRPGMSVLVPFLNKRRTGYVVTISDTTAVSQVKSIIDILDPEPVVDAHMLQLTHWLSNYYLCAWGEAIKNALPPGVDTNSRKMLIYHPGAQAQLFEATMSPDHVRGKILGLLKEKQRLSMTGLRQMLGDVPDFNTAVMQLIRSGHLKIEEEIAQPKIHVQREKIVQLAPSSEPEADEKALRRSPKRAECLAYLAAKAVPVSLTALTEAGFSRTVVSGLVEAGLLVLGEREIYRDPLGSYTNHPPLEQTLTADQSRVFDAVRQALDQREFRVCLIHGVTGSGKTRVYVEACLYSTRLGMQSLVLVPEIALTPQTIQRFHAAFKGRIGLWHSHLSSGERFDTWRRIKRGDVDVVIGTRSAIFAPFPRLGLLVVDEENETSFKQEAVPRYNGRDVAVMRAKMQNAVCLLGSATPSLETYYNAVSGRYTLLELPIRIEERPLPVVEIVDMRHEPAADRISRPLTAKIEERLAAREGIILFLNRRGFSTFVFCRECGFVFGCDHCHVSLTYHAVTKDLKCHYCNSARPVPPRCIQCSSFNLSYKGAGTQRVEDEIQRRFKKARVLRLDVDSTTRKGAHRKILDEFRLGLADILLGTQMVAKGLDFPNVTLVGVISADVSLNRADFRAAERTFQLLTQVAGRAGRGDKKGEVIIQTYSPTHYAIQAAKTHDYHTFYRREIKEREELAYPPFARLIAITISHPKEPEVIRVAEEIRVAVNQLHHPSLNDLLGPAPALVSKIEDRYRWQIMIKSDNNAELRRQIYDAIYPINVKNSEVSISIDVDPF